VGGRADLMDQLAPNGPVYQAGTLSGNPLCVAAGLATLRKLQALDPYAALAARTRRLAEGLAACAKAKGIALAVPKVGSMWSPFFRDSEPRDFAEVMASDAQAFRRVFASLLEQGIYLPPSPFETSFLSIHHTDALVDRTLEAWDQALSRL
jgi:glutamate-1-semialdehyde 2,1-aminomutase